MVSMWPPFVLWRDNNVTEHEAEIADTPTENLMEHLAEIEQHLEHVGLDDDHPNEARHTDRQAREPSEPRRRCRPSRHAPLDPQRHGRRHRADRAARRCMSEHYTTPLHHGGFSEQV